MNQSNVDHNNNKFYIVQVLLEEASNAFYVWTRWGRVGVPGMNANKGPWGKDAALKEYHSKVNDKQKGGYVSIEIKYEDKDDKKEVNKADTSKPKKDVASKMDAGLQRLISLIFDVNVMNNAMKEIGYDATRMPLGKLGETTIKQAYEVLTKLSTVIKANNTQ